MTGREGEDSLKRILSDELGLVSDVQMEVPSMRIARAEPFRAVEGVEEKHRRKPWKTGWKNGPEGMTNLKKPAYSLEGFLFGPTAF